MKAAIFDVDGVILDSMEMWDRVGSRYLNSIGVEPEATTIEALRPMSLEEGAAYLKENYNLDGSVTDIVQKALDVVREDFVNEVRLKDGVKEYLEYLHSEGVPMAIATSDDRRLVEAAFDRLGIRDYFCGICTCSEVGAGKSCPDVYLAAACCVKVAYATHVSPGQEIYNDEIAVFEDTDHALVTAKFAGFETVGVYDSISSGRGFIENEADIYIGPGRSFADLIA